MTIPMTRYFRVSNCISTFNAFLYAAKFTFKFCATLLSLFNFFKETSWNFSCSLTRKNHHCPAAISSDTEYVTQIEAVSFSRKHDFYDDVQCSLTKLRSWNPTASVQDPGEIFRVSWLPFESDIGVSTTHFPSDRDTLNSNNNSVIDFTC